MSLFRCDWDEDKCRRKPYIEVYFEEEGESKWCYLCWWHYIRSRLRRKEEGYCRVENTREAIESLREDVWEVQSDLYDIKEKIGLNKKKYNRDESKGYG